MKTTMIKFCVLAFMLLALPLFGLSLVHKPIGLYLDFPPRTLYVPHAPFSWPAFAGYALFILAVLTPLVIRALKRKKMPKAPLSHTFPFPWWGYLGILLGITAWVFAWNRFSWFEKFQPHTFTPLWIAYIITINALTCRRTGHCILLDHPRRFLLLFPISAQFWWFFEYLNRFVQNWSYVGADFGPGEYFLYATLSFSTVLPAFTGTRQWLLSFAWPERRYKNFLTLNVTHPKVFALGVLLAAGAGLTCLGILPNLLFPLLWISPLLILVSLQTIMEERHIFSDLSIGDWHMVLTSALAALICGLFWEMWNHYSLAKWVYHVPFVHRFQLFEMPILGYAGYLPFGLECALIADIILVKQKV